MRKTYNAPEMKVVKIQTAAGMLVGASSTMDLNRSQTVEGSAALSRRRGGNFWDDDEDY